MKKVTIKDNNNNSNNKITICLYQIYTIYIPVSSFERFFIFSLLMGVFAVSSSFIP